MKPITDATVSFTATEENLENPSTNDVSRQKYEQST